MIRIFKTIVEIIKLWKSFFNIPFVISNLELYAKEHSSFLSFVLWEAGDTCFDGWCQIVVIHCLIYDIKSKSFIGFIYITIIKHEFQCCRADAWNSILFALIVKIVLNQSILISFIHFLGKRPKELQVSWPFYALYLIL